MDSGYSLNFWPRRQIDYQTILVMAVGNGGQGGGTIMPPSNFCMLYFSPITIRGGAGYPPPPSPRMFRTSFGPEFWT